MAKSQFFVITGGGSGIGQALTWALAERGHEVMICGRREDALLLTAKHYPSQIHCLAADISDSLGREQLVSALADTPAIAGLIHNAASIHPMALWSQISVEDWRRTQQLNVETPLFLTQALIPQLKAGRVLHISSGWAHMATAGVAAYCASKAALHMLYQIGKIELTAFDIAIGSVMPGIVDSDMQQELRQTSALDNNTLEFFQGLHANQQLVPAKTVAAFLTWLLCDIDRERFSEKEWDIYDSTHREKWCTGDTLPLI